MLKKPLLVLVTLGLSVCSAMAQNIEKGWKLLENNQRTEAVEAFETAVKKGEDKDRALASLAIAQHQLERTDEAQKTILELAKNGTNPDPYLYGLWNYQFGIQGGSLNETQLKVLKVVLSDERFSPMLKGMANQSLGVHYTLLQEDKDAAKYFNVLGAIKDWQIVGMFDNISASGFDKNFDPISMPQADAVFVNKNDAKMNWQNLLYTRIDHFVDFSFFTETEDCIQFAQTFVNSPDDREATICFSASGSLKLWVNDAQIGSVQEERNTDLDIINYKIKLKKGYNRILVQLGISDNSRCSFMARLLNKKGEPFTDLSYSAAYQAYSKDTESKITQPLDIAEHVFFEKLHKESPNDLLNTILLGQIYNITERKEDAKKLLTHAIKQVPNCSAVRMVLLETYIRLDDDTEYSIEKQKLVDLDPDNFTSIKILIDKEKDNDNLEEADKLTEKLHSLYGDLVDYYAIKVGIVAAQSKYNELIELSAEAFRKYPDNSSFVFMKSVLEREVNKNPRQALNTLKRHYEHHADETSMVYLANAYENINSPDDALELYIDAVKRKPYLIGYFMHIADTYFGLRNYSESLKWVKKAIAQAPYIGYYWRKQGDIYMEQGDKVAAKESYQKSLYYNPLNYDIRKKIRIIDNKKDIYSYFSDVDAYNIIKKAPNASQYPDDNSVILHYEVQNVVYPEGGFEQKSILIAKVLNTI